MGQALWGLQEKKTTSSWNPKPPRTHRASWEAGGVRGHLLCKFSFHTTGRKWFSPKRVH